MSVIAKWGNSLAIRIPKNIADRVALQEGVAVTVEVADNSIVIKPKQLEYSLDDLLADVTEADFSGEYDWGEPTGEEVW